MNNVEMEVTRCKECNELAPISERGIALCVCRALYSSEIDPSVESPRHYNSSKALCPQCARRIECIDVIRHLNFNLGNAIKYLWRCEYKNNKVQDLRKAIWYIQNEINRCEKQC